MIDTRLTAALADRYELLRELGAGGMATVFLADDFKHRRKVALKVLRPELAAVIGAERFLKEIETTANLQHPHILPLHDSGQVEGTAFYVMPFVEGETLRDRLDREKQLPIPDAVRIAREIASALDYAHRKGVIHRDIKPENILLHEGLALVADFGIALAAATPGGARMTETGMSLGTPHYMSPEQAMGERALDARSDVYALGCVLYEMLVGEPPFTGPTAQAIVARVLTGVAEAPSARRSTVPPNVSAAVLTAVQKLPADRFATAAAMAEALQDRNYATAHNASPSTSPSSATARVLRRALVPIIALAAGAAGFVLATLRPSGGSEEQLGVQFVVSAAPSAAPFNSSRGLDLDVSPDGRHVVYVERTKRALYVRSIDSLSGTLLPGTEAAANPVYSPDGKWIAFTSGVKVLRTPATGGSVLPIGVVPGPLGLSWTLADTLLIGSYDRLVALPLSDGNPIALTRPDTARGAPTSHRTPAVLPGGRGIIYYTPVVGLMVLDRRTGQERVLDIQGSTPRWSATGHIVYAVGSTLWAVPFDVNALRPTGKPAPVLDGVANKFGSVNFAIARDAGALVYMSNESVTRTLVFLDSTGRMMTVGGIASNIGLRDPRFSPDGNTLAYSDENHLFTYDIRRATTTQLAADSTTNYAPVFTPDGKDLIFTAFRATGHSLRIRRADGSGSDALLSGPVSSVDQRPMAISPDGSQLLVSTVPATVQVWIGSGTLNAGRLGEVRKLAQTAETNDYPTLSPDGRWMAFRNGTVIVAVRFPSGDLRQQLSAGDAGSAVWSRDGRTVYYISGDSLMAVPVRATDVLSVERPRLVARAAFAQQTAGNRVFDVDPHGRVAAVVTDTLSRSSGASDASDNKARIIYAQHWTATLQRLSAK